MAENVEACLQAELVIHIVGPHKLQNELIAGRLEEETGAKCLIRKDICQVPFSGDKRNDIDIQQRKLVLWDCQGEDLSSLVVALESYGTPNLARDHVALFNVSDGLEIEEKCVGLGVCGFFYEHDPLAHFLKGIRAIIDGQLWFSRDVMTKYILANNGQDKGSKTDAPILTRREGEVLAHLAVGATNEEIADKLCISPHTVKTHLYNVYKKINVPNRLQAAFWAAKNL